MISIELKTELTCELELQKKTSSASSNHQSNQNNTNIKDCFKRIFCRIIYCSVPKMRTIIKCARTGNGNIGQIKTAVERFDWPIFPFKCVEHLIIVLISNDQNRWRAVLIIFLDKKPLESGFLSEVGTSQEQ